MVESSKAKMERTSINKNINNKVKETWDYNKSYNYGKDSKFSWPPRPYTCSFCKREFRSAQALGGHMNVHRRDRARLNQSIPWDINLHHANFMNPYYHDPSSSTTTTFTNHHFPPVYPPTTAYNSSLPSSTTPPTVIACSSSAPPTDESVFSSLKGQENVKKISTTTLPIGDQHLMYENYHHNYQCYGSSNNMKIHHGGTVRLDLEIGLCSENDVDLELRLGFS